VNPAQPVHFTSIRQRRRTPSVIIVSLIDVLLVVLIFLMVTTTFKKAEPILRLALPESKQAKPGASDAKPFLIYVSTNAPYFYLGERPVTIDRLQTELESAARKEPQLRVLIKADRRSPLGEAIKLIDLAKAANVGSINFVTEKTATP
jgi:biopolymer transport protein ExbD